MTIATESATAQLAHDMERGHLTPALGARGRHHVLDAPPEDAGLAVEVEQPVRHRAARRRARPGGARRRPAGDCPEQPRIARPTLCDADAMGGHPVAQRSRGGARAPAYLAGRALHHRWRRLLQHGRGRQGLFGAWRHGADASMALARPRQRVRRAGGLDGRTRHPTEQLPRRQLLRAPLGRGRR